MGLKKQAFASIEHVCRKHGTDMETVKKQAMLLLSAYKMINWMSEFRYLEDGISEYSYGDRARCVEYLINMKADEDSDDVTTMIRENVEISLLKMMIGKTMETVRRFPYNGEKYTKILQYKYVGDEQLSEPDLLERIDISHTQLYRKQDEAMAVFGMVFFLETLPKFREELIKTKNEMSLLPEQA